MSGLCIIILALYFKKIEHIQPPLLESALPGFVFTIWEAVQAKHKDSFWSRPRIWGPAILLTAALVILRRVLF